MGKNLIQQARGKGGPRYRAPSFRYLGEAKHNTLTEQTISGKVEEILHCPGHSAPIAKIRYENGEEVLSLAVEGMSVGDTILSGQKSEFEIGNVMPLKDMPMGAIICNIESKPGDGGKFVRASGAFAKIIAKTDEEVIVELPSRKRKAFNPQCRATVGVIAGGGRLEKPFLKAGRRYYKMKARNKLYPIISGAAQNAVDHPFGCSRSSRKAKAKPVSRNAPPGRKV
ncbi:MAG: 50S ribosomal protein L2, partial [Candidatus Woesearchaeota archaeon]|nr:50S ribosomal protein L2 [Candidatus Woesearchaeota archaeon]